MSTQPIIVTGVTTLLAEYPARIESGTSHEAGDVDVFLHDVHALANGDTSELQELVGASKGVIALGRNLRPDLAARALQHGALLVASMRSEVNDLVAAVEAVYAGVSSEVGTPAPGRLAQAEGL